MPRYGLNMLLWTMKVTEEHFPLLEKIRGWGYDGVEIPILDNDLVTAAKVGAKLKQLGLEATAVTVCTKDTNPASPDPAVRQAAHRHLCSVLETADILDAKVVCGPVHSALGEFTGKGPTNDELKWSQDVLRAIGNEAAAFDITLAVEYLNRFECYLLTCAASAAQYVKEVNHPNVRMMYDTFHANLEECSPTAALADCGDLIAHFHVSESHRGIPGTGQVHWDEMFNELAKLFYDSWFVVEAFGLALPALAAATKVWRKTFDSEEQLAVKALAFMKQQCPVCP